MLRSIGLPELFVIFVVVGLTGAAYMIPLWRILNRVGRAGAIAMLAFIPGGTIVVLWVIAFIDWPSMKTRQTNL